MLYLKTNNGVYSDHFLQTVKGCSLDSSKFLHKFVPLLLNSAPAIFSNKASALIILSTILQTYSSTLQIAVIN